MTGQTLLHYNILEKLGAGGMGEVYRAQDTKLGRGVAIKVLPQAFARDPERLARLEREARVLASLNHPNIAAIYGFEQDNGVHYLVLELVPGPTLAQRGRLEVAEALRVAGQIAEAFEAAQEKGVVHRDLKPANVKVTPEGKVKVLDFGLAKAFSDAPSETDPTGSPTVSALATRAGLILGTASYMSPEQARGKPLDKRTDIWSFGCVLYEALTGKQAFGGETVSHIIVAILEREPDWAALPAGVPAKVRELLRRCLQKDLARRLRDIGDARWELEEAVPGVLQSPTPVPYSRARLRALPWALAGMMAVVAALALWAPWLPPPALPAVKRFVVPVASGDTLPAVRPALLALSPDGQRLVYTAGRAGRSQLFLRPMDQLEASPITGTEDGSGPFFSPDGEWVGFFTRDKLKKVSLRGGAPLVVCDAMSRRGASWGPDNTIVLASGAGPLMRVSADGGALQPFTTLDTNTGETEHRWPEILPDGKAVVFNIATAADPNASSIAVRRLDTSEQKLLPEAGLSPRYVPPRAGSGKTGHLVFVRAGSLMAAPFDSGRLELTGRPFLVMQGVAVSFTGSAHFSISHEGSLVYLPGGPGGGPTLGTGELIWVDRQGAAQPVSRNRQVYAVHSLSPDGRRVAVSIMAGGATDVWVLDVARDTLTRLTLEGGVNGSPLWTPDGKRVTYYASRQGPPSLYWRPADGSGPEERLTSPGGSQRPNSWSPDAKVLAFDQDGQGTGRDLWLLPTDSERKPRPFLQTKFDERMARFSPDGRWLAYAANDSGRFEVYVQPFPGPGAKSQVSTDGGDEPVWSRNGRELFYRNGDKILAVYVKTAPAFTAGTPRALFQGQYSTFPGRASYDVSADGRRFLMTRSTEQQSAPAQSLHVVLNWLEARK